MGIEDGQVPRHDPTLRLIETAVRTSGYPGVAAVLANGSTASASDAPFGYLGGLGPADAIPVVDLSPGGQASSMAESWTRLSRSCALSLSQIPLPDCSGQPEANPVVPGALGRSSDS